MSNRGLLGWLRRRYEIHHGNAGLQQMLGLKLDRVGRDYKGASHKRENERRRRQVERGILKI
jgi:hypothetical protein